MPWQAGLTPEEATECMFRALVGTLIDNLFLQVTSELLLQLCMPQQSIWNDSMQTHTQMHTQMQILTQ